MPNVLGMRSVRALAVGLAVLVAVPAQGGHRPSRDTCKPITATHSDAPNAHATTRGHKRLCRDQVVGSVRVSTAGGLGQIDINKNVAAVVQRDEGIVALVDITDPTRPNVLGRYEDDVNEALDGDVSFSDDGEWLFFARQTSNFDEDGVHVLDVSDPIAPALTSYQPGGGSFRLEYYKDSDGNEWVIVLDAIDGLVVNRFVRESGSLVRVFQDATPALKVGGPASAGLFVSKKDPRTGTPLLYVTTGRTGLQIYDLSTPAAPEVVGGWDGVGLADLDVRATKKKRKVFAATEYWFDKTLPARVIVLDATKLDAIEKRRARRLRVPADDHWRVQGIDWTREGLYVAHSHAGVIRFKSLGRRVTGVAAWPKPPNEGAGYTASPYAMDVVMGPGGYRLTSDASSGVMSVLVLDPRRSLE